MSGWGERGVRCLKGRGESEGLRGARGWVPEATDEVRLAIMTDERLKTRGTFSPKEGVCFGSINSFSCTGRRIAVRSK